MEHSATSPAYVTPDSCPTCRRTSIVTTAKVPDAQTYWRCTTCGAVWNSSRVQTQPPQPSRWR